MRFKEYKKLLAVVTVSAMIAALPGASALAKPADDYDFDLFPATKNETVYIKTDETGASRKVIVSDQLQNIGDVTSLDDISSLTGIENIKGDEEYTQSGKKLTWKSDGDDIVYQGESDAELPVGFEITYELDGESISPKDLAGKSGHLAVHYHFTNNKALTNNRFTPFLMVTATVLKHEQFKNVEVSGNGHLESDGQRTIAVGYSIPGLVEYLGIDEKKADLGKITLSDDFTFEADVENYETPTTGTVAMNDIFSDVGGDSFDNLTSLKSSLNKLADSSNQLVSGSEALSSGIKELERNVPALKDGVGKLASGSSDLKNGTDTLATGANQLSSGIGQMQKSVNSSLPTLKNGVGQLASGASALNTGMKQAAVTAGKVAGGIDTLNQKAGQLAAGTDQLAAGAEELGEGISQMSNGVSAAKSSIDQLASVAGSIDMSGMSAEDQAKLQQVIGGLGLLSGSMDPSSTQALSAGAEQLKAGISQVDEGAQALAAATSAEGDLSKGASGIAGALSTDGGLGKGAAALDTGLSQVSSGVTTMSTTLGGALGKLSTGASDLASGASSLNAGAGQLKSGIGALNSKIPTLSSGIGQLSSGASELSAGMKRFDQEGIDKLVGYMDGDVGDLLNKAGTLFRNAKAYNNYSGLAKGMDGTVKFVFVPDEDED